MSDPLARALHAIVPAPDELALFSRFVGPWSLHWRGRTAEGGDAEADGELTFGVVLAGRAVQDVWRIPPSVPGDPGVAGTGFHGTTIRFPDPSIDAWRSTWVEPLNARVRKFVGAPHGDDIVLLSVDGDPHLRWSFVEIADKSFTWIGEASTDGGHTWFEEERMRATRR